MYCLKDKQFDLPDNCTLPPNVAAHARRGGGDSSLR